jgi:hypothetical protein
MDGGILPKTLWMHHKRYRLYRIGHTVTILRESTSKNQERPKCDEMGAYFHIGERSVWIWLVLCPIALENETIVEPLIKAREVRQEDTGDRIR